MPSADKSTVLVGNVRRVRGIIMSNLKSDTVFDEVSNSEFLKGRNCSERFFQWRQNCNRQ